MPTMTFVKPETIDLQNHPDYNEKWVQDRIAEDPSILGLGNLILRDKERPQPRAGRLDLLLQDPDTDRRYEVEIQLGKTDESHIIRTLEYWDLERKRYPQYDHCAVIVAEDITSRFLNIISLFNGTIPLIAIKMQAITFKEQLSLIFTTVLDELALGLEEEDEELQVPADRAYWESHATKETVKMADALLDMIKSFAPQFELKFNKFYIGLARDGKPNNFAIFRPKKLFLKLEIRMKQSDETQKRLEDSGLDLMEYDKRWGKTRIRLTREDLQKHHDTLKDLLYQAYKSSNGT